MAISDWPEGERPRERLLAQGAAALSDAELLAIYLRVGLRGKSAVDLASDLLKRFDGHLGQLAEASLQELASVFGIAKAAQLKATFELARRALAQEMSRCETFASPATVRRWLQLKLGDHPHEVFMALWLNSQNQLLRADELFSGTLAHNAAAVILAHPHSPLLNTGFCRKT